MGDDNLAAIFPTRVLQVLGLPAGSVPLTAVSHDSTLSGNGTAGSPLAVVASSDPNAPSGYTGPTLRNANQTQAAICLFGTGVISLPTAQMTSGDVMVFCVWSDNRATVVNAAATLVDGHSYSNGQFQTWIQTWNGSDGSTTFTNPGHNIFEIFGCVVAAGSRGSPALLDTHGLDSGTTLTNYGYIQNPVVTPGQANSLSLFVTLHLGSGSTTQGNRIVPPTPVPGVSSANIDTWQMFTVCALTNGYNAAIFGSYRIGTEAQPGVGFTYVGASGGAGNQVTGTLVLY